MPDFIPVVGSHALQPADGDGLLTRATPAAGWLARSIAYPTEDAGKHVAFPVDHVGFGEASLGDQPDVFRNVGMRGATPLAIDNLVEVRRV